MKHYRIIQTKIDLNHRVRWPQMLHQHILSVSNGAVSPCDLQEPSHAGCVGRPHRLRASPAGEGRPAGRQGQEGQHGPAPGGRSHHMAAMNGNLYSPAPVRLTNKASAVLPNALIMTPATFSVYLENVTLNHLTWTFQLLLLSHVASVTYFSCESFCQIYLLLETLTQASTPFVIFL